MTGRRGASAACLGLAAALGAGACAMGIWSTQNPAVPPYGALAHDIVGEVWGTSVLLVIVVSLIVLVWCGDVVHRRRSNQMRVIVALLVAGVASHLLFGRPNGVVHVWRELLSSNPRTPQIPAAVAAGWLTVAAMCALLVALPVLFAPSLREHRVWLLVGVLLAVALTGSAGEWARRAGANPITVEATAAQAVPRAALPTVLGKPRLRQLLAYRDTAHERWSNTSDIASAGAGFVVMQNGRLTAYGPDGQERWHYQRTRPKDPFGVNSFRVFDDGATIVVYSGAGRNWLSDSFLVGLDAMTGHQLWASPDITLAGAYFNDDPTFGSPYHLMAGAAVAGTWTRWDTRTGKQLWSIDTPIRDCDVQQRRRADTASRLVSVVFCGGNGSASIRVAVTDPATGHLQRELVPLAALPPDPHPAALTKQTGPDWITLSYHRADSDSAADSLIFINPVTGEMRDGPPGRYEVDTASQPGAFVVLVQRKLHPGASWYDSFPYLYTSDGQRRCELGLDQIGFTPSISAYIAFDTSVLFATAGKEFEYAPTLRTLNTQTCTTTTERNLISDTYVTRILRAPGVLLSDNTFEGIFHELIGYT